MHTNKKKALIACQLVIKAKLSVVSELFIERFSNSCLLVSIRG